AAIETFTIPAFGALSDRLGRRPVYIFGAVFSAAMSFPLFMLLATKNPQLGWIAIVLGLAVGHAAMYGPQASFLSELFGTKVRYSGVSLGYNLASIFAGAVSPWRGSLCDRRRQRWQAASNKWGRNGSEPASGPALSAQLGKGQDRHGRRSGTPHSRWRHSRHRRFCRHRIRGGNRAGAGGTLSRQRRRRAVRARQAAQSDAGLCRGARRRQASRPQSFRP